MAMLLRGAYSKLNGSRDSSLPTSNFYNIQSGATASSPRTATWAPIGNTSQALTSTLASASFNTPLATGISPNQYGGNTNSSKPDVNDIAYNVDAELNYNFGPIKTTYLGSVRQYNAKENSNALIGVNLPGTFNGDYTQQSHELRLASTGTGPLKIQGGLYYFRENRASPITSTIWRRPLLATPISTAFPSTRFQPPRAPSPRAPTR
jgi:iron complex outermembrane receptor protein